MIVAGGGAYYFAKKSINAERAAKAEADRQKRIQQYNLEQQYMYAPSSSTSGAAPLPSSASSPPPSSSSKPSASQTAPGSVTSELGKRRSETAAANKDWQHQGAATDDTAKPSQEASADPAPTRHAPVDEEGRTAEKSKYEASDVFRSRKGDRFS